MPVYLTSSFAEIMFKGNQAGCFRQLELNQSFEQAQLDKEADLEKLLVAECEVRLSLV